jgi:hypothetical protein
MIEQQKVIPEDEKNRADKHAFIKRLIIGKVILLLVLGGIVFYLVQTI